MPDKPFELICEIEPATRPDLRRVRHQIGVLASVASAYLIPDNHLGRATVSSIAVAHEVQAMGGDSIACLNCRDRNLLGLRRDLLTAAAYGVERFLCVHGDDPSEGGRTSQLTVRRMIREIHEADPSFRAGAATRLGRLAPSKRDADFLFVQVSFSVEALLRWREGIDLDQPVYPGVLVVASPTMAKSVSSSIPDCDIPTTLVDRLERNRSAGVDQACEMVMQLKESGAFEGVHLVPVGRYRDVAARLERELGQDTFGRFRQP